MFLLASRVYEVDFHESVFTIHRFLLYHKCTMIFTSRCASDVCNSFLTTSITSTVESSLSEGPYEETVPSGVSGLPEMNVPENIPADDSISTNSTVYGIPKRASVLIDQNSPLKIYQNNSRRLSHESDNEHLPVVPILSVREPDTSPTSPVMGIRKKVHQIELKHVRIINFILLLIFILKYSAVKQMSFLPERFFCIKCIMIFRNTVFLNICVQKERSVFVYLLILHIFFV